MRRIFASSVSRPESDQVSFSRRNVMCAIFLLSVIVFVMYRPWSEPAGGDAAIYDYISQSIVRGQLPYRDVADRKSPGGPYLSALAMLAGELIGLRDIIASRILHVLMGALVCVLAFWLAAVYLKNTIVAMIAALVIMMSTHFAAWTIAGGQPKLPMILFGMLTLAMIAKDRWFWSGVFSSLSFLCWQPGLLFAGTAFLIASRYLTNWRDFNALKVLIGAAVPVLVVLLYFYSAGNLADWWSYTIEYNFSTFRPDAARNVFAAMAHVSKISFKVFGADIVLVVISVAGCIIFAIERIKAALNRFSTSEASDLFRDALLIPPLVYLGFCLLNFQSGPDLIPLFPFVAIFASFFFLKASRRMARFAGHPDFALVIILALLISVTLFRAISYRPDADTLLAQDERVKLVSGLLGSNGRVYAQGRVELLVLLNRPNLNPYIDLDWGMDRFVAAQRYGGSFDGFIDELESQAPEVVSISRIGHLFHKTEIERWLSTHYEKVPVEGFEVYLRKTS